MNHSQVVSQKKYLPIKFNLRPVISLRLIVVILLLKANSAYSQKVEIGQNASEVKNLIEWVTKDHNRFDSYGNSSNAIWSSDVKYFNGEISEVIQCYENQYLLDLQMTANYCKRFIMQGRQLSYILTQYENVSIEKLKELYVNLPYSKNGQVYFSDDYNYFSKLYLSSNGIATIEYRKADQNSLPENIKKEILFKQRAFEVRQNKVIELPQDKIQKNQDSTILILNTREDVLNVVSTLHASNFNIMGINGNSNGKELITNTAKQVDKLRISFDLDENVMTQSGPKELYILITPPNGKVISADELGSGKFTTREGDEKVYTQKLNVNYTQNKRKAISLDWKQQHVSFETGTYKVEVYNNGFKVGEGHLNLLAKTK